MDYLFTMSNIRDRSRAISPTRTITNSLHLNRTLVLNGPKVRKASTSQGRPHAKQTPKNQTPRNGGARRDRTDDLKLAKLPLSQLSYGPSGRSQEFGLGLKRRQGRPSQARAGV